jgi:hypothetical protein
VQTKAALPAEKSSGWSLALCEGAFMCGVTRKHYAATGHGARVCRMLHEEETGEIHEAQ